MIPLDQRIPMSPGNGAPLNPDDRWMNTVEALVEPGRGHVLFGTDLVVVIPEAESRYAAVIDQLLDDCRGGAGDGGPMPARRLARILTAGDPTGELRFGLISLTSGKWAIAVHGDMCATIDDEMVISGARSLFWRELLLERPFFSVRMAGADTTSLAATECARPERPGTVPGSGVLLKPRRPDDAVTVPHVPIATAPFASAAGVLVLDDGTSCLLEGTIVLGREPMTGGGAAGPTHRLTLNDEVNGVSRVHAEITVTGTGDAVVTDLGSANGTYVCNRAGAWTRLAGGQAAPIAEGFRLRIGERQMHITAMARQNGSTT